jgi:asparagine synthetase B (glutamine-hydrolysing)
VSGSPLSLPTLVFDAAASGGGESARLADLVADRSRELDPRALAARMLLLGPFQRGETPYLGVSAARTRTIDTPSAFDGARVASSSDAVRFVRCALEGAVDRAFGGARRVAVLTGGGLDSAVLLALALRRARRSGGSAFGVALDFGGPGDDRPHLSALEAHLGCEIVRIRPEDAAHRFHLVRRGVDAAPLTWPGAAMEIEMLARARELGAECALMGVGADDLFDGEPRAIAELVRRGRPRAAIASARELRGFVRPRVPVLSWIVRPLLARMVPTSIRSRRARKSPLPLPAWAGPRLAGFVREWRDVEIDRALTSSATPQGRFEAHRASSHLDHLAWLRHQEQVASGLERRDPYLDLELVAKIVSLQPEWLLRGDIRRGLFREAARDLLPDSLRDRLDKASFEPAFARFVAAANGFDALRPFASAPRLAALGLVDSDRFRAAFAAFVARPEDSDAWGDVWPAIAIESFLAERAEVSG